MNYLLRAFITAILFLVGFPLMADINTASKLKILANFEQRLEASPQDSQAAKGLLGLSKDEAALVRAQTIYAIGTIIYTQNASRSGLTAFEKTSWVIVQKGFTDREDTVRQASYQCAIYFKDKIAISLPYLEEGLKADGSLGSYAADTIGSFGSQSKPAIPSLVAQLIGGPKFKGGSVGQTSAADALGNLGVNAHNAVSSLEGIAKNFSDDPEFVFLIIKNLHEIDPTNSVAIQLAHDFKSGKYGHVLAARAKGYFSD
jgi:hypothetical protein